MSRETPLVITYTAIPLFWSPSRGRSKASAPLPGAYEAAAAELGGKEVPTDFIGSAVMNELHEIDQVAYVRFASVYRSFKDIDEFMHELEDLIRLRKDGGFMILCCRPPECRNRKPRKNLDARRLLQHALPYSPIRSTADDANNLFSL